MFGWFPNVVFQNFIINSLLNLKPRPQDLLQSQNMSITYQEQELWSLFFKYLFLQKSWGSMSRKVDFHGIVLSGPGRGGS